MRIVRLQAEGFKRLVAVDITPDGDLIEVRGNNGEGKSSVLDAIFAALAGKAAAPVKPVRDGEEYAIIRVDLGDLKVTRFFDQDGASRLKVENGEGATFSEGQTMLNKLIGAIAFDPLEFANMDPKDQAATLRSIVKLDVDLDELAAARAADYAARRDVNRDAAALKPRIEAIQLPNDLPDEAPDTAAIADALAKAGDTNAAIREEARIRDQLLGDVALLNEQAAQHDEKAAELRREADFQEERAKAKRADAASFLADVNGRAPLAAPVDVTALRQSLADADRIRGFVARRDERDRLVAEFRTLKAKSDALTKSIDDRDALKAKALAEAKMPVDGLSFAEVDGDLIVTLNGIPFSQASGAEQLKTSVAVAMAANPKLRVLRVKDGSLLDRKNLEVLRQIATDHDFQIWAEFVGDEGAGVIMEAGKVRGAPDPEPLPAPKRRKKAEADVRIKTEIVGTEVIGRGVHARKQPILKAELPPVTDDTPSGSLL